MINFLLNESDDPSTIKFRIEKDQEAIDQITYAFLKALKGHHPHSPIRRKRYKIP
jgi:hypothetical protein